jgi:hypothetical protein
MLDPALSLATLSEGTYRCGDGCAHSVSTLEAVVVATPTLTLAPSTVLRFDRALGTGPSSE